MLKKLSHPLTHMSMDWAGSLIQVFNKIFLYLNLNPLIEHDCEYIMNEFSHFLVVNENSDKFLGSNCINTVNKVLEEYDQPSNEDNQNNSRSGITLNKYRNQIA